jgi:hypothetical protein
MGEIDSADPASCQMASVGIRTDELCHKWESVGEFKIVVNMTKIHFK